MDHSVLAKRYTLLETLDYVLDSSENEEGLEDPEEEDYQESEEDCQEADADQTFSSKTWSTTPPPQSPGRSPAA